jgi:hypothetical protein
MTPEPMIDANRLCAAADALLEAMGSEDGMSALVTMRVDEDPPPSLRAGGFTHVELVRAMSMLIRLGLAGPLAPDT